MLKMKPKFQQIWFISGIKMILKQAKISILACFLQLLRVGGYKDHQVRAETTAANGDHMWREGSNLESFTNHLKRNSKCFILFAFSFFFLKAQLSWSVWFTKSQCGLMNIQRAMVSEILDSSFSIYFFLWPWPNFLTSPSLSFLI